MFRIVYTNITMPEDFPEDLNELPPDERDRIINEIIEQVIRPQLEDMSDMFPDAEGEAFVFGGKDETQAKETMERIQGLLKDGLSMDYIIQEMTDLHLTSNIAKQVGEMTINFVNIDSNTEHYNEDETLSAEELQKMFDIS